MISPFKAKKMLSNGCVGYLAHIVDTTVEAILKPEDVYMVKNFLEVCLEDTKSSSRSLDRVRDRTPTRNIADL